MMWRSILRMALTSVFVPLIAVSASVAGGPSASAQEYVMKLAHVLAPGSPRDKLLHAYAENIEERTNGRIKAIVYPSAQLGNNRQVIEGLQLGTIEGTVNPTSFMGGFEPLLTIFDIPFFFRDIETASRITNSDTGRELMAEVEPKGIKGLAFYVYGYRNFATKFPIHGPSDLEGKKLRVVPSPIMLATFQGWGSNPVPIPFPETYNALAQGVVVGQEQTWDLTRDMKFYEVSPYLTETRHGIWIDFFFISKKWYDQLPEDLQKAVVEEAQALVPDRLQWGIEYMDAALAELKAKEDLTYIELTPEEQDAFRIAIEPAREAFLEQNPEKGAYFVKKFEAAIDDTSGE